MSLDHQIADWLNARPVATAANTLCELRAQVNQDIIQQQGIEQDSSYQTSFWITTSIKLKSKFGYIRPMLWYSYKATQL